MLSRVNMFSEFVVKGFPEGGGSSIPQGKVIDFPLEGVSSPQKRWLFWSPGIWGPENTTAAPPRFFSVPPTPDFPCVIPDCTTLLSLGSRSVATNTLLVPLPPVRLRLGLPLLPCYWDTALLVWSPQPALPWPPLCPGTLSSWADLQPPQSVSTGTVCGSCTTWDLGGDSSSSLGLQTLAPGSSWVHSPAQSRGHRDKFGHPGTGTLEAFSRGGYFKFLKMAPAPNLHSLKHHAG